MAYSTPAGEPSGTPQPWISFAAASFWQQLAAAPRSVLMLDYDGTLAPFNRDRMQAVPFAGVNERLLRLAERTRLVLVSGRPLKELAPMLPPELKVEMWGNHGRERLTAGGDYQIEPLTPVQQEWLDRFAGAVCRNDLAVYMEAKMGSIALHTRGRSDQEAKYVLDRAEELFATSRQLGGEAPTLEWHIFDGGVEIRATGCTKANAVNHVMQEEASGTPAAYLGDDQTDEDAFRVLEGRGLCVLVREEPRPSAAQLWLRPPTELLAFLDRWLEPSR